jgi:hypothetical protein
MSVLNVKRPVFSSTIREVEITKTEIGFRAGAYYPPAPENPDEDFGFATIDVITEPVMNPGHENTWLERIHVFGRDQEDAVKLRDHILYTIGRQYPSEPES